MSFHGDTTVRFSQVDAAGVMFYSRYFEVCHHVLEDCLSLALGDWFASMVSEGWAFPLSHAEADFKRPARLGERLAIVLELASRGTTSLTFLFEVQSGSGEVHARIQHVHTCIDLESRRPTAVPERFITALAEAGLEKPT